MTKLSWDLPGERFYETGVDRGVLFVNNAGTAWNGLISVEEKASGGEPTPYYIDGFKYINLSALEEFEITIEAFSCPAEFGLCDGTLELLQGLYITQQRRKAFDLSYRTKIGNDVDSDLGYKIHLIYNALAAPSERRNASITDRPVPTTLSWSITTAPPAATGYRPTAHMIVDSRRTDPEVLTALEDILYGTDVLDPDMPSPTELAAMFS